MNEWMNEWMNECSLTFGAETFVFQSAIQICNNLHIRTWNFPTCLRLCHIDGGKQADGVHEEGAEVDVRTQHGVVNRAMGKTGQRGALWSELLTKYYLADKIKKNETRGAYDVWETGELHAEFWWGIYCLGEDLLASQEGLCSVELVS